METIDDVRKEYINPHGSGPETFVSKSPQDCKYFHTCSASLCPLDPDVTTKIWLPEENDTYEICRNPEFAGLQFVITQKKIRKALRNRTNERDDCFTYGMLNRNFIVRPEIRGISSDPPENVKDSMAWYAKKEKAWLRRHPEMKLSKDDIEKLTSRFKKEWEVTL
jgi:hypothetical protein